MWTAPVSTSFGYHWSKLRCVRLGRHVRLPRVIPELRQRGAHLRAAETLLEWTYGTPRHSSTLPQSTGEVVTEERRSRAGRVCRTPLRSDRAVIVADQRRP